MGKKYCNKCGGEFFVDESDLKFYEKISPIFAGEKYLIPEPSLCVDCRQQRRLAFRNERKLYKSKSSLRGKDIISIYSPNKNYKVYSPDEWWGESWDAIDYGRDYNFEKKFFEQFEELFLSVPKYSISNTRTDGCDYTNNVIDAKNCYLTFGTAKSENAYYVNICIGVENCIDMSFCTWCSNSGYCLNCSSVNNAFYSYRSTNCGDIFYCSYCNGCSDCAFCVNLFNKKYCILNVEYTKEDFFKQKERILNDERILKEYIKEYRELLVKSPKVNLYKIMSENCQGDMLINSNNAFNCYDSVDLFNCKNLDNCGPGEDCMDVYGLISDSKLNYETLETEGYNILFSWNCMNNTRNLIYCIHCVNNTKNCFGCVGLKNKEYCIFNKQYSKEEYEKLVPMIIKNMEKNGEWGEFFPSSISPFGYNETVANDYFPLDKDSAIKQGFIWNDFELKIPKVEKIISAELLPYDIKKIPDDILNWAIKCEITGRPFLIIKEELDLYRKNNLPIPKRHPDQRHYDRMKWRTNRKLFDGTCSKCNKDIKTTYSPNSSNIIYCEECYMNFING